jgi:serine/threonine-protein kinase
MSPEQIAGKKVDGRSDLYSLGVMLFQMLTGILPFRGDSMAELMYKIGNEEAPDIRVIRVDLSDKLAQVVATSLAKKPDARYQDGEAFARELRALLASLNGEAALAGAAGPRPIVTRPAAADDRTVAFQGYAQPRAADRTSVLEAGAIPGMPDAGSSATTAFEATEPAPLMEFAATLPAGNALRASLPPAALPGYDAAQKQGLTPSAQFEKTSVMTRSGAPDAPHAGNGKTGQEP